MPRKQVVDPEVDWVPTRLIPSGKTNQTEQERRATSVLLAVLPIVPSFARAILSDLGAPGGKQITTYAEVRLKDEGGKVHIPDGAICIKRGTTTWTCLVEVKTGTVPLKTEQVERYLDLARANKFDALLTISNQIRSDPKALPFECDKRKIRGLKVRQAARHDTLRASDEAAQSVAARWQQFTEYLCLHLSQLPREKEPEQAENAEAAAESTVRREQKKGLEEIADLGSLGFLGYS